MRRLLGSFERSLSLLNAITDGVIAHDDSDQLLYVNDAMALMSGYPSAESMADVSVAELIARLKITDDGDHFLTAAHLPGHLALAGQEGPEREFKYLNPQTGEPSWLTIKAQPVIAASGEVQFAVSIIRDITQRKQLETRTLELVVERERVKVLQRFVGDMSHDFRTPLSILSNSLYLMQRNTDPERQQAHAAKAEHQIQRMENLLDELLQIARLDENKVKFEFRLTDINIFLEPLIQEYELIALEKNIALKFLPQSEHCFARIDSSQFEHIFTNLIENAIAYTPKDGYIAVSTGTIDNQIFISVKDTGIGISAEDLPHIFERFYRADQARSTNTGGNGLGLSIVQRIIEEHHGKIEVSSVVDQGTNFVVRLPESTVPKVASA
ncbi:MAG: PAS domain-containing sensor histidine kinase [Chloroflexi bacterium]|nr:PAS domain-containing sensor histidine kinase [Chloroflexota bacterium]MCC6894493.1 PAS domain S-box protein [Anaerolineae bacterium]